MLINKSVFNKSLITSEENFIILDRFNFNDISSTEIRKNINNKYLDNRVKEYIINNKLNDLWR